MIITEPKLDIHLQIYISATVKYFFSFFPKMLNVKRICVLEVHEMWNLKTPGNVRSLNLKYYYKAMSHHFAIFFNMKYVTTKSCLVLLQTYDNSTKSCLIILQFSVLHHSIWREKHP